VRLISTNQIKQIAYREGTQTEEASNNLIKGQGMQHAWRDEIWVQNLEGSGR
jgi:hypothetical protein